MCWTYDLERQFTAKTFIENENTPRFVLIKISDYNINKNGKVENNGIYKAVGWCWKIKPSRANNYPYVLAVRYGIVIGVYQVNNDGWKK